MRRSLDFALVVVILAVSWLVVMLAVAATYRMLEWIWPW